MGGEREGAEGASAKEEPFWVEEEVTREESREGVMEESTSSSGLLGEAHCLFPYIYFFYYEHFFFITNLLQIMIITNLLQMYLYKHLFPCINTVT